jgi:hypothetical protein
MVPQARWQLPKRDDVTGKERTEGAAGSNMRDELLFLVHPYRR